MILKPRVRLVSVITLLIATSILYAQPSYSLVKAGSPCTKLNKTSIVANKKYTCVKVGKKLQWNKGTIIISQTPAPISGKTETPAALSEHEKVVNEIGKLWAQWREKSTSSYVPLRMITQPGFDSAWQEAKKPANILISTFVGNGYKLLPEPISIFGDTEEWLAATGRPIACGRSVPEQPLGIYCGHIQMGFAYFSLNVAESEKFVGKSLTPSQIQTINYLVAHDVATMFELQAHYGDIPYNGSKNQIPAWIREGFVQLFAALAISDSNSQKLNYYQYLTSANLIERFPTKLCTKTLQNFESKDRNWGGSCASSQNFYGVELLVAKHGGFEALFKFVSSYGTSDNWTESFESAFGISREDFYAEWYEYLGIPKSERPALTPAAIPAHN
jgi:hypothetical protein